MNKLVSLKEAVSKIQDGMTVGIGGNVLHRAPMAFLREVVRSGKKQLKAIKTAGAHDVDLLARAGALYSVDAGFISYETTYGLARYYRKGVESGLIKGNEHACYTVMCALRAAKSGVGFMPIKGLQISDLIDVNDYFKRVADPFTGEAVTVVKAIAPDVTIIHVQECDREGNCLIYGPKFDDVLMAKASKKIIVTAEKIVDEQKIRRDPSAVALPGFLVDCVVHIPKGAQPCSVFGLYDIDDAAIRGFLKDDSREAFDAYMKRYERQDQFQSWEVKQYGL
ncbi:MAG: CoA transferase subunit A [Clostridia bacterium]|nr:CoA transferase subunit A [Clostridia bacterium]